MCTVNGSNFRSNLKSSRRRPKRNFKKNRMANFTKADLQNKYNWSVDGGDNPKLRGEPDSSLLDRTEGYEVLYMIKKLMDAWKLKNVASGQKIEDKIHACPSNLRSQENLKNWIDKNW